MNRNHVFLAFGVTFLVLGALVAFGGGCTCAGPRFDFRFADWSTPSMNGVELPHKATLHFSGADAPKRLALSFEMAEIVVTGDASVKGVEAEFEVHEKTPGDASLAATADGVEAKSASGAPVLVSSAKIRVPPGTPVQAHTALGGVVISGISDVAEVAATAETGDVEIRSITNVERVHGKSGLGDVSLSDAKGVGEATLEVATGAVRAKRVAGGKRASLKTSLGDVRVETLSATESLTCQVETGDVRVVDVRTADCRLKSGLGDVRAERSTFDHVYAHTGLGGVRLAGCTYKTKDVGTDLGGVKETK